MPASVLARIAAQRPDHWRPGLVEELLVAAYKAMSRGVLVHEDKLVTASGTTRLVTSANIWPLVWRYLEGPELRTERDVLRYCVIRAATGAGLSHTEHARLRYHGRSRKWLLGVKRRGLELIAHGLNADGYDPAATVLPETAKLDEKAA